MQLAPHPDLEAVRRCLLEADLPTDDLAEPLLDDFLGAVSPTGELVGVVGLERRGEAALLRSLAVREVARRQGLGEQLVQAAESHALATGVETLYLLTTTAASFFERRGYRPAARADVPDAIASTAQFSGLCPDVAVCLCKHLPTAAVRVA